MTNKLNKLTWKYFLKQKLEEIVFFFGVIIGVIIALFVFFCILVSLGKLSYLIFGFSCSIETCLEEYLLAGMITIIVLFITGLLLYAIFYKGLFECWIKPNWKKARTKARKELKVQRKRK